MYPTIITMGDFVISSYGLMLVIAFYTCNLLLRRIVLNNGYKKDMADDITFRGAIGGIVGAKLYYMLENISSGYALNNLNGLINIFKGIFSFDFELLSSGIQNFGSGMVFLGGLIGGTIAVTLYIYKHNLIWSTVADWVAPLIALGHSIGRVGCFLVGDDYGKPTALPWGIKFDNGLPISNAFNLRSMGVEIDDAIHGSTMLSVHPTQLYEMALYLLIFIYLSKLKTTNLFKYSGQLMHEYLFLAGFVRFVIEFIRLNPSYILGLSGAQIISLIMMGVGSLLFYKESTKLNQQI